MCFVITLYQCYHIVSMLSHCINVLTIISPRGDLIGWDMVLMLCVRQPGRYFPESFPCVTRSAVVGTTCGKTIYTLHLNLLCCTINCFLKIGSAVVGTTCPQKNTHVTCKATWQVLSREFSLCDQVSSCGYHVWGT
jgi:hypothetical protein